MKIIFLDIDGVLNNMQFFINNHNEVIEINKNYSDTIEFRLKRQMLDIDINKINILKSIINETNAMIIITSTWKRLSIYPYIKEELIKMGLPIIGETIDNSFNRGEGIKNYIKKYNITDYVILDDDIFDDYDDNLLSKLVKTSFYEDGLCEKHKDKVIKLLK